MSYRPLAGKAARVLRGVWCGRNARAPVYQCEMGRNKFKGSDRQDKDTYRFWEVVALGAVPVTLRGPLDGLSKVPSVSSTTVAALAPADLVAWRQNLTERFGDLDAATRTARRTVLNSRSGGTNPLDAMMGALPYISIPLAKFCFERRDLRP